MSVVLDFEPALGAALRTAERLLQRAEIPSRRSVAVAALGIDLADFDGPSLSADEQQDLFTAGPLYLAGQLEAAGLSEAIDTLAGLFVSGALPLARGTAANRLADLWEHRHLRFTAPERAAIFARLFGGRSPSVLAGQAPVNTDFRDLLIDLAQALAASGSGSPYGSVALGQAADNLARNLAPRLATIPERTAHDLLDGAQAALALFREPDLLHAVQASNPRLGVTNAVARYVGPRLPLDVALDGGGAGQVLLGWVAAVQSAPSHTALVPPPAVVAAAVAWARATLQTMPASPPGAA